MTKILRLPEVMAATGLSRSSIYAFIQKETFPRSIPIGERARGWKIDEIEAWIEQRSQARAVHTQQ